MGSELRLSLLKLFVKCLLRSKQILSTLSLKLQFRFHYLVLGVQHCKAPALSAKLILRTFELPSRCLEVICKHDFLQRYPI